MIHIISPYQRKLRTPTLTISNFVALSLFILTSQAAWAADAPFSFAEPVSKVAPATVTIVNALVASREEFEQYKQMPEERRTWLKETGAAFERDGKVYGRVSIGSGFIIDSKGHIITNHHVISADPDEDNPDRYAADALYVSVGGDGTWQQAHLVGTDPSTDLAVIRLMRKADDAAFPTASWGNSTNLKQGDIVLAIGTPLEIGLKQTVTMGVVSATGRTDQSNLAYSDFIQTDAAINGGNSGGPLCNTMGEVVGINQSIALGRVTGTSGRFGGDPMQAEGNIGIGFAIPSALAKEVVADLIAHGRVKRGFLGVKVSREGSPEGLWMRSGLLKVTDVLPNSPALAAGVAVGDLIMEAGRHPVPSSERLHLLVSLSEPGSLLPLKILRDGQETEIQVKVGDLETSPFARIGFLPLGMTLPNVAGVEIRQIDQGITPVRQGGDAPSFLGVIRVAPGSPAAKAGLVPQCIITEVAGVPVRTAEEFAAATATSVQSGHLLLRIQGRNFNREISVPVATDPSSSNR